MTPLLALVGALGFATAVPVNCAPFPHVEEKVTLLEPRDAAIFDPRGIWIEFSVLPFGGDIRGVFTLSATARPIDRSLPTETLVADRPLP